MLLSHDTLFLLRVYMLVLCVCTLWTINFSSSSAGQSCGLLLLLGLKVHPSQDIFCFWQLFQDYRWLKTTFYVVLFLIILRPHLQFNSNSKSKWEQVQVLGFSEESIFSPETRLRDTSNCHFPAQYERLFSFPNLLFH